MDLLVFRCYCLVCALLFVFFVGVCKFPIGFYRLLVGFSGGFPSEKFRKQELQTYKNLRRDAKTKTQTNRTTPFTAVPVDKVVFKDLRGSFLMQVGKTYKTTSEK